MTINSFLTSPTFLKTIINGLILIKNAKEYLLHNEMPTLFVDKFRNDGNSDCGALSLF